MKIKMFGQEYEAVFALNKKKKEKPKKPKWEAPKPKDLHKEMTKSVVSRHYIASVITKLASDFKSNGAELVRSDQDAFVSIHSGDAEVIIAPIFDEDSVSIAVERLNSEGELKLAGFVVVDNESTYKSILELMKKFVKRATSY